MMARSARFGAVLLAGVVLFGAVFFVGCSAESARLVDPSDPYGVEFDTAIAESSSDFVKKVLADHEISAAEFAESQASYVKCLQDVGFQAILVQDEEAGKPRVAIANLPDSGNGFTQDPKMTACSNKWVGDIEFLYDSIEKNPNNEDWNDLVAACFVREGLAPEGFSGKDLEELELLMSTGYSVREGEEPQVTKEIEVENPAIPGTGVLLDSNETVQCYTNPLQTGTTPTPGK